MKSLALWSGSVHSVDYQQRRKFRFAGDNVGYSRDGARRNSACGTGGKVISAGAVGRCSARAILVPSRDENSLWHTLARNLREHYLVIALTIGCSLIGVVMFGTLAGSMLPFILRTCGLDPASASASVRCHAR